MSTHNESKLIDKLQKEVDFLKNENLKLKNKQVEIDKAKELYLGILEDFPALIWRANTEKLCDYFNHTWLDFTGRTMDEEYGYGWADGVHPDDLERCVEIYTSHFDNKKPFSMQYRLKNRYQEYRWILDYGRPYYDIDGTFLGYIGSCYDITDNKRNEERLKELAITDPLTKIYNRLKLDTVFENEISRTFRYGNNLSVILIDIDNFKSVNDSYGHTVGDLVLVQVTQIIKENIRETDTLGRWGGEEFLIISPELNSQAATLMAEKLRRKIEEHVFPKTTSITCSFGVSSYKKNDNSTKLLNRADKALYSAKNNGKNKVSTI